MILFIYLFNFNWISDQVFFSYLKNKTGIYYSRSWPLDDMGADRRLRQQNVSNSLTALFSHVHASTCYMHRSHRSYFSCLGKFGCYICPLSFKPYCVLDILPSSRSNSNSSKLLRIGSQFSLTSSGLDRKIEEK